MISGRYLNYKNLSGFTIWFVLSLFLFSLFGCASSGSLGGGPRDTTPPKLIESLSSPNNQLNSSKKKFEFVFDEFIEIRDAIKEVLVSPPFIYIPKVVSRGKKLIFEINEKEELKENTTYVINFGNAIIDLNESNALKNFRLVFSTGDQIDSLKIEGEVMEVENGKPASDITILVYDELTDSVLLRKKPFYTARTDNNGKFLIENVKSDTFRIFAIKDENRSYTYNQGTELLGFLDSLVVFKDTQQVYSCALEISKPLTDYRIFESDTKKYGLVRQKWNTPIYSKLSISPLDTSDKVFHIVEGDSVKVFYTSPNDSIAINFGFDTLNFKTPDKRTKPSGLLLRETTRSNFISVTDSVIISANYPIKQIDVKKISLRDTSGRDIPYTWAKTGDFNLSLYPKGDGFSVAQLNFSQNAVTDIFDNTSDSNSFSYTIVPTEKLAEISLNIVQLDSTKYYTIFFKDKNEKVLNTYSISDKSSTIIKLSHLKPEDYTLELIEDTNKNGRWDPVNWWQKTQAEKVKKIKVDGLKENWALEREIKYTSDTDK